MAFFRSVVVVMLVLVIASVMAGSYIQQASSSSNGGYSQSFTSQTSVALAHNLGTTHIEVQCFTAASPPVQVEWNTLTVNSANTATVTFTDSQSGYCVVLSASGGGGGSSYYQTIQVAGVGQTQEPVLNFAANVTCTNTPGVSTNCTPSGGGGGGSVPTTGWVLNQAASGLATLDDYSATGVTLAQEASGLGSGALWALATQTIPGSTYTVIVTLNCMSANANTGSSHVCGGPALWDGTKFEDIEIYNSFNINGIQLEVRQSPNVNTGGTIVAGPTTTLVGSRPTLKVVDDGTHRTWYYYGSGAFVQFYQEASGTFITPTRVGLITLNDSASNESYVTNTVVQWTATSP